MDMSPWMKIEVAGSVLGCVSFFMSLCVIGTCVQGDIYLFKGRLFLDL
jgi:hypothetical protein